VGDEPRAAVWSEKVGDDTYALVMVMPPSEASPADAVEVDVAREVVFVIDTSGSMEGGSLDQARQAVLWALDRLRPQDSFNVIEFNSFASKLFPASVPAATQALREARAFVAGLQATGGTEMLSALEAALRTPAVSGAVRQVVFATDGSVGNEAELARYIEVHRGASRLFPVGIGSAPNRHFIEQAATVGRGTATTIADPAEVGVKMSELFAKLSRPAATDLAVQWSDPRVESWPAVLPDLYWGEPVMLTARLPEGATESLEITGRLGDESFRLTHRLGTRTVRSAGVEKLWAREKIASLSGGLLDAEFYDAAREEILAVALTHHLVSEFTSLVAVEKTPAVSPGERQASARLPVTRPDGWAAEGYGAGALPQTATPWRLLALLGAVLLAAGLLLHAVGAIFRMKDTAHVVGTGAGR
jgi:Ca-activated chloride channel family protein